MNLCSKCKNTKERNPENFRYDKKNERWHSWCRLCENAYTRAYFKTARGKSCAKKWRANNMEKCREIARNQRKKYPLRFKSYDLKKSVGISLEEKDAKLVQQGGLCAICRVDKPNTKKVWFADHDHKTGKFRGVLCGRCNSVLGYALDNPAILLEAANYLNRTEEPVF